MSPNKTSRKYKYCLVPKCTSKTTKYPNKLFVSLPIDKRRRSLWLKAMRRNLSDISFKSSLFVCGDHFNWEEDVKNYIQFKYYKGKRIDLKPDVVPHIFACQTDRSTGKPSKERKTGLNRIRKNLIQQLMLSPVPSTSEGSVHPEVTLESTSAGIFCATPNKIEAAEALCLLGNTTHFSIGTQTVVDQQDRSIMVKPHVHSKFTQCNLMDRRVPSTATVACSPIKFGRKRSTQIERVLEEESSSSQPSPESTSSCYSPKSHGSEDSLNVPQGTVVPKDARRTHILMCESDPLFYLGVSKTHLKTVSFLSECLNCEQMRILICLQKIRLDSTYKELGYEFGVSESYASKFFYANVPPLSKCLSKLVQWPEKEKIKERLPVTFRARYFNVQCIIDRFEVEIEKPLDPIKQTLTWSNYKKCNKMKYLISCTPDGLINFVSGGFGGRTSDTKVVEQCGFLDIIPNGAAVMADRGFKGIAPHLEKKQRILIRPPSVASGERSSKEDVTQSKRIASLRIHVERVIRRVREFSILKPHSCVNHNLVKYLDFIVKIVTGLVNLQEPLIKQYV